MANDLVKACPPTEASEDHDEQALSWWAYFEKIVSRMKYHGPVWRNLAKNAEDAAVEVILRGGQRLSKYSTEEDRDRCLPTMVSNALTDFARKEAKIRRREVSNEAAIGAVPAVDDVETLASRTECAQFLERELKDLPDDRKKIYALRQDGYSWLEIAEQVNCTEASARQSYSRLTRDKLDVWCSSLSESDKQLAMLCRKKRTWQEISETLGRSISDIKKTYYRLTEMALQKRYEQTKAAAELTGKELKP